MTCEACDDRCDVRASERRALCVRVHTSHASDQAYVDMHSDTSITLTDNCELAIIPPLSGG